MGNQKNYNGGDYRGKGRESNDSNNRNNSRHNENGRANIYTSTNATKQALYKTLNGMKPRPKK